MMGLTSVKCLKTRTSASHRFVILPPRDVSIRLFTGSTRQLQRHQLNSLRAE